MPTIDLTFPHTWQVSVLACRPLIAPGRQFVYPRRAEEVERGALELLVSPEGGGEFLATCALGFADPHAPTGVWSCPHADWLCAVSGGYAYLIDTSEPDQWRQIEYRPVLQVRAAAEEGLLLFVGHHSILAWGRGGQAWQTERLSSEGVEIREIADGKLHGLGWDMMTDRDIPFILDLQTGASSRPLLPPVD